MGRRRNHGRGANSCLARLRRDWAACVRTAGGRQVSLTSTKTYLLAPEIMQRVLSKVLPSNEDGCWLWGGYCSKDGYGEFSLRVKGRPNSKYRAHRLVWAAYRGEPDPSLDLDHLCRIRACVNPSHLEMVTRRENLARGLTIVAPFIAQDKCSNGHPYTTETTYRYGPQMQWRRCRTCDQATSKRQWAQILENRRAA
jgi:hypothetical protein